MSRRRLSPQSGTTLIEVLAGTVLLVFGALTLIRALIQTTDLTRTNRETAAALRAAELQLETLRCEDFAQIFALYNASAADDPAGGAAPGPGFAVAGLRVRDGDADGVVGRIEMPAVPDGLGGLQLREDVDDASLGMPRDLNGDGAIDGLDHSADYVLLPVRARIEWRGVGTSHSPSLQTLVGGS
jgi:hypothetical protein